MKDVKKAVALRYSKDDDAPFIVASEKGILAQKVLEIAEKAHVPIIKNNELANVLSLQQIGSCIPEETWSVTAKIFAFIMKIEESNDKLH